MVMVGTRELVGRCVDDGASVMVPVDSGAPDMLPVSF